MVDERWWITARRFVNYSKYREERKRIRKLRELCSTILANGQTTNLLAPEIRVDSFPQLLLNITRVLFVVPAPRRPIPSYKDVSSLTSKIHRGVNESPPIIQLRSSSSSSRTRGLCNFVAPLRRCVIGQYKWETVTKRSFSVIIRGISWVIFDLFCIQAEWGWKERIVDTLVNWRFRDVWA